MRTGVLLRSFAAVSLLTVSLLVLTAAQPTGAQSTERMAVADAAETRDLRTALQAARRAAADASTRAARLNRQAAEATAAQDQARLAAARLAARLQEAEAAAELAQAQLAVIEVQQRRISRSLAARREPLVRLTAALQRLTAQPLALSALQPGSLREAVYLRAVLEQAVPVIEARTSTLRAELAQSKRLARQARIVVQALRRNEAAIESRRTELLAQAAQDRRLNRQASRAAEREARRAADMALEARNLNELVGRFDQQATLRAQLAALSGPVMRPAHDVTSVGVPDRAPAIVRGATVSAAMAPGDYRLPVIGRLAGSFGDADSSGLARTGLSLVPRPGALAIAPAAGRIAFAGPFRGFDNIVIIEHPGGWTSLVTGLGTTEVRTGQQIVAGGPLGTAPARQPLITLELRHGNRPVDPLPHVLGASR